MQSILSNCCSHAAKSGFLTRRHKLLGGPLLRLLIRSMNNLMLSLQTFSYKFDGSGSTLFAKKKIDLHGKNYNILRNHTL